MHQRRSHIRHSGWVFIGRQPNEGIQLRHGIVWKTNNVGSNNFHTHVTFEMVSHCTSKTAGRTKDQSYPLSDFGDVLFGVRREAMGTTPHRRSVANFS
jgi:hypothetical protein